MLSISSLSNIFTSLLHIGIALAILLLMVTIHELGHYIAGRILNFKINEFAVGFGKVLFQKTNKRGEKISLRLFPLGGFCAFEGEGDGEEDKIKPDSFNAQKPWKRIIVYVMGPLFNIISAVFFSFILLVSFGYDIPQVTNVSNATYPPASEFVAGDVIREVDGTKVNFINGNPFPALLNDFSKGEEFEVTVQRNGKLVKITTSLSQALDENGQPETTEDGTPILVIGIQTKAYRHTVWEALARAIPFTIGLAWLVLKGIFMAFTFQAPVGSVSGPIGAIGTMAKETSKNIANLFLLLPLISVNLGVFNLLPIPALDGSHVVFSTVEWIRKKPINRTVESYIHFFGFLALIGMVVLFDILNIFAK
jgi:regulator of sigma E protease